MIGSLRTGFASAAPHESFFRWRALGLAKSTAKTISSVARRACNLRNMKTRECTMGIQPAQLEDMIELLQASADEKPAD